MSATPPPPSALPDDADARPTSDVLRSMVDTSQALVKKEVELAKLEVQQIVTARLVAAGLAVVAATVALFVLAFVGVTAATALELVWPAWLAWLVVTLAYTVVVAGLLAGAYHFARRTPSTPERSRAAAEQTLAWARGRVAPYAAAAGVGDGPEASSSAEGGDEATR